MNNTTSPTNHPIIYCKANLALQGDPQNRCLRQCPILLWTAQALSHCIAAYKSELFFQGAIFHAILDR